MGIEKSRKTLAKPQKDVGPPFKTLEMMLSQPRASGEYVL